MIPTDGLGGVVCDNVASVISIDDLFVAMRRLTVTMCIMCLVASLYATITKMNCWGPLSMFHYIGVTRTGLRPKV